MLTDEQLFKIISEELDIKLIQVRNTISLLDENNTVPFIARYRKEATGSLDEEQIRAVQERIEYLRGLEARKETILTSIEEQGKLTPELKAKIEKAMKMQELEDLYLPYRPKKRTRATIAKEKGLEPLATVVLMQELTDGDPLAVAAEFVNPEKEVATAEEALAGACDIIAETISENADLRKEIRERTFSAGAVTSSVKTSEASREYEMYFEYSEPLSKLPPHRILALNRGEKEGALKVDIEVDRESMFDLISSGYITNPKSIFVDYLTSTSKDAYTRLIEPAIHREVRAALTEKADEHAIHVFAVNLKNLLLQPPVLGKNIIGIDPGFRTGSKVAVIDATGKYLEGTTIYPHPPQKKYFEAKSTVRDMVEKHRIEIIAIGNGTASRETETMVAELIGEMEVDWQVHYIIVNEAGASVYSASPVAREEFPELDVSMRGNISIARRLQDPLAELVKIDPKSIGVGLYQHDVNQRALNSSLHDVVESCVNMVGVDLNTASASLLRYVSGLTSKTAGNIVQHRNENGPFHSRAELKTVSGIGSIAFQQAAGFLRIRNAENPLDSTSIHPESYDATTQLLAKFNVDDFYKGGQQLRKEIISKKVNLTQLAEELAIGIPTLEDILKDLEKPGRDPRDEMPKPILKSDVLKMEDLREGMILKGTVRNVVDFGVFVDIGVKHDGLVHISQLADRYVKNPLDVVSVGDVVDVRVVKIDIERERIGLSMRTEQK
jgi:uncharacterized protein